MSLTRGSGSLRLVSASGEVDLSTAHKLDAVASEAMSGAEEGGRLIMDLTGVEFMDVTGLNALLRARQTVQKADSRLSLVCSEQVEYLLEVAGLDERFDLYPDLDSAARDDPGT